jgi:PAS domain-containing protein
MSKSIPTKFFDMLPLPIVVVKVIEESLNYPLVYLNPSFCKSIGWSLEEIPDKNHWWKVAYPDLDYQKVVERLWEVSIESIGSDNDSFVSMTVNIMTKHNGIKRYTVYTEVESALLEGYYVVAFEEIHESMLF